MSKDYLKEVMDELDGIIARFDSNDLNIDKAVNPTITDRLDTIEALITSLSAGIVKQAKTINQVNKTCIDLIESIAFLQRRIENIENLLIQAPHIKDVN